MFKSFSVWKSIDNSWTGGGISYNENFMSQIDEQINNYCQQNNLKVSKVDYSSVNENIQHGSASFNVEKRIYFMAAVSFEDVAK